jgi:7-cyano-7-deazaguanine reductase
MLSQLGARTPLPSSPGDAEIECIPWLGGNIVARFSVPEFSSLCPVTNAPDFARLVIDYVPNELLIESKSLKLFMGSFRNHGCFHERVVADIGTRLFESANPKWMRICAFFNARGGIPIDVFWMSGDFPAGTFLPDVQLAEFRGR